VPAGGQLGGEVEEGLLLPRVAPVGLVGDQHVGQVDLVADPGGLLVPRKPVTRLTAIICRR